MSSSFAQPAPVSSAFEVASIKVNNNCDGGGFPGGASHGSLNLKCISLRGLIRMAYSSFSAQGLTSRRFEVLGGPSWLDTERYDVLAKATENAPPSQMMGPMLRVLLEERFKVKAHMEPRESRVYALRVMKDGPKLKPSTKDSCTVVDLTDFNILPKVVPGSSMVMPRYCGSGGDRGGAQNVISDWYGVTMTEFSGRMLSTFVDLPVIDKTELTGRYDVHLEFARGEARGMVTLNGVHSQELPAAGPTDGTGRSIFSALRELGLRLVAGKSPLTVIVVDEVERLTPN
jgi:uncharacterized protein (TIGR03435 family)